MDLDDMDDPMDMQLDALSSAHLYSTSSKSTDIGARPLRAQWPQIPRMLDILRETETGWYRKKSDRATTMRMAATYLEEDTVINGSCHEGSCELPPDVRCTIAVASSSDGTVFATSHGDHAIRIFSLATKKVIAVLEGHARTPWTLSFHRQNPHLLVSGCLNGELRLWDMRLRQCVKNAVLGADRVTSACFHPESSMVAAACGKDLYFWDVSLDAPPVKVLETTIGFLCLYFHPNGNWLLTCEVRSLGNSSSGPSHTPHFCIRLRDLRNNLRSIGPGNDPEVEEDLLPMVLVYSESGMCISPCGKYLAVCLPPNMGSNNDSLSSSSSSGSRGSSAGAGESMAVDGEVESPPDNSHGVIAIVSLQSGTLARTLCTAPIPRSAKVTCMRFSYSCRYLLAGYGGRDMRPSTVERLRRGLEIYRFETKGMPPTQAFSLNLVRDMTVTNDVLNAAEWQPALGGSMLYGTDTGRTVALSFQRGREIERDLDCRSPNASDQTTGLWSPPPAPVPTQAGGVPPRVVQFGGPAAGPGPFRHVSGVRHPS